MTKAQRLNLPLLRPFFPSFAKAHLKNMEIVAQWLDNLDDVVSSMRLLSERFRNFGIALIFLVSSLSVQLAGVFLALKHPPLALATATIMLVTLMYHTVTAPRLAPPQTS